jgi:hypothetical protein
MKNLIKKILREETSGLTDRQIKAGYALMNILTKGYHWYSKSYGTWLINPDTKEWMFEFDESGHLRYHYITYETFYMYLNMEVYDFESFIKIWVEDVLKRGVVSTGGTWSSFRASVENVLKNGKQLK